MASLLRRHKLFHHLLKAVLMSALQGFTRRRHIDLARVASASCCRAA
ncbi:putative leader peptide [Streptomyces sp. NPDC048436]